MKGSSATISNLRLATFVLISFEPALLAPLIFDLGKLDAFRRPAVKPTLELGEVDTMVDAGGRDAAPQLVPAVLQAHEPHARPLENMLPGKRLPRRPRHEMQPA